MVTGLEQIKPFGPIPFGEMATSLEKHADGRWTQERCPRDHRNGGGVARGGLVQPSVRRPGIEHFEMRRRDRCELGRGKLETFRGGARTA